VRTHGHYIVPYGFLALLISIQIGWLLRATNWLTPLGLFNLYLDVILCFGHIYFLLYSRDRSNFLFGSEIRSTRVDQTRKKISQRNQEVVDRLATLRELHALCLSNSAHWLTPQFQSSAERSSEEEHLFQKLNSHVHGVGSGSASAAWVLRYIFLPNCGIVGIYRISGRAGEADTCVLIKSNGEYIILVWQVWSGGLIEPNITNTFRIEIEDAEHEMSELQLINESTESIHPRIWHVLDFIYFSVITQTTVGYGDILPNSTLVRVVVAVQIMLGLFLLSVAITAAM